MRLFGFNLSLSKAVTPTQPSNVQAIYENPNAWFPVIREPFTGAWQRNMEERPANVLMHPVVFRCISLISSDIAKMPIRLMRKHGNGIWTETESPAFSPVLRKPNRYQNRIQFYLQWMESKLISGNTYVLKERDNRGVVVAMYVLNPNRCKPLVAPDGSVFYQLAQNDLAGITNDLPAVPASEVIHDRFNTLYHPLIGMSPMAVAALAAVQGLTIQQNSATLFAHGSKPGGILTAPGKIDDVHAKRLKEAWDSGYTGANVGKVAVLGDGLKFERVALTAEDNQLIEQVKWTSEMICTAFGVPAYKVGVGPPPAYNNVQALNIQYYSDCIQIHAESIELCIDEGIGLDVPKDGVIYGTELDTDNLLRMDTATLIHAEAEAVGAGIKKPDEGRRRLNLAPVEGGDTPYLQEQNFSLAALAKRDAMDDPWASRSGAATPPPTKPESDASPEASKAKAPIARLVSRGAVRDRIQAHKVGQYKVAA